MELDAKNIARAIAVIVVIAIFVYLYYDRRNVLKQKLKGRDYLTVLGEQTALLISQLDYMQAIINTHLNLLQNGVKRGFEEIHVKLAPIYSAMERELDASEEISEIFPEDAMKLLGQCKSMFSDLGFKSRFFDVMEAFGDESLPFAEGEKPLHKAFMQTSDDFLQFGAAELESLAQKAREFEEARQRLVNGLNVMLAKATAKGKRA